MKDPLSSFYFTALRSLWQYASTSSIGTFNFLAVLSWFFLLVDLSHTFKKQSIQNKSPYKELIVH